MPQRWSVENRALGRGLLAILVALAIPAGLTFHLSQKRTFDLLEHAHYNDIFDASQAETALYRLNAEIGRFALSPSEDGADLVRLRFDIFLNHLDGMSNGVARRSVDAVAPDLTPMIGTAAANVAPVIAGITDPGGPQHALDLLTPLEGRFALAVSAISEESIDKLSARGAALQDSGNTLLVLALALLITAVGLAAVLWRQHAGTRRLAYRDTLTHLANRLAFNEDLLARTQGDDNVALLLIDLDDFKDINDSFGHDIGDALLRQIASRLRTTIPTAKMIARIGGDEFAVLLDGSVTVAEATGVAERLCAVASEPLTIGELTVRSSLSIGVLVDSARTRNPISLFKRADLALYAAKAAGRGRHFLFNPGLERDFQARLDLEEDLRDAIARDGIDVQYQVLVDLATGRPLSCEALARWTHPRQRSNLIVSLGERVMARACAEAVTWPASVRVAVNVSVRQMLEAGFFNRVVAILADTGLAPERLDLEITESVLIHADEEVLDAMRRLRRMGVTFALDDFGTGYSSLGRLHHLPLDKIKIDQSFVRAIESSRTAFGIIETIIDLSRKLGMATTAEGIETEAQHRLLLGVGCQQGQGYLYGKSMEAEACRLELETALSFGPTPHGLGAERGRMAVLP
ncbi:MAG: putative bifunctional diguanylate cyclase/phosphodiesterase [Janthinobacterium lividum]